MFVIPLKIHRIWVEKGCRQAINTYLAPKKTNNLKAFSLVHDIKTNYDGKIIDYLLENTSMARLVDPVELINGRLVIRYWYIRVRVNLQNHVAFNFILSNIPLK